MEAPPGHRTHRWAPTTEQQLNSTQKIPTGEATSTPVGIFDFMQISTLEQ